MIGRGVIDLLLERKLRNGAAVVSHGDARRYLVDNFTRGTRSLTLRRETPKVRGKAARRAEKKARARERERTFQALADEPQTPEERERFFTDIGRP